MRTAEVIVVRDTGLRCLSKHRQMSCGGYYRSTCMLLLDLPSPGSFRSCAAPMPYDTPAAHARRNVERELINHRSLLHPNIIRFKEVFVTTTHLGIVMEYAAGGELFDRIVRTASICCCPSCPSLSAHPRHPFCLTLPACHRHCVLPSSWHGMRPFTGRRLQPALSHVSCACTYCLYGHQKCA